MKYTLSVLHVHITGRYNSDVHQWTYKKVRKHGNKESVDKQLSKRRMFTYGAPLQKPYGEGTSKAGQDADADSLDNADLRGK